jgi:hypothetical protein
MDGGPAVGGTRTADGHPPNARAPCPPERLVINFP